MRTIIAITVVLAVYCPAAAQRPAAAPAGAPRALKGDMILWYRQPAQKWLEAMPIGNGRMGAMVFGRIGNERIALNESSFLVRQTA